MDKKLFKQLILLITFAVILVAFIVKLDAVGAWVGGVLHAFRPLFIGFAIAFVLNRPCNFFARLYARRLPERGRRAPGIEAGSTPAPTARCGCPPR